jgi:hypothetical protein
MKRAVALGLMLFAVLAAPTASVALEARGIRHAIPCFMCPPDATEGLHIVRSTGAAPVVVDVNIYDVNGIFVGAFIIADPAGTFQAQQIAFVSSTALTQNSLPAGLYAAILFDGSLATQLYYEEVALGPSGVTGILTGRGDLYNYFTAAQAGAWALVLYPEVAGGTLTGLSNVFVCNVPSNNMATFLGIPGAAPGAQGVAQLVTVTGDLVLNNFTVQNLFMRNLTAISPGGGGGGSLRLLPPGAGATATRIACVKILRIDSLNSSTLGYTY